MSGYQHATNFSAFRRRYGISPCDVQKPANPFFPFCEK
jgi:AraC-like DNA-binding protein